jgi:outer membrane protein assembly factor BamB
MMRLLLRWRCLCVVGGVVCPLVARGQTCDTTTTAQTPSGPNPFASDGARSVLTAHNDNARTGAYLADTVLSTATVCPGHFGKLFTRLVDGQMYAQPLYVSHLALPDGTTRNVVYVATMHNMVYAFDADDPAASQPVWSAWMGVPVPADFMAMPYTLAGLTKFNRNVTPEFGITSTPVIDLDSRTIFLVAKTCERDLTIDCSLINHPHSKYGDVAQWLHALDITTGRERPHSPMRIRANCFRPAPTGNGVDTIQFKPGPQFQRPALLLANGRVYVAFASHQDQHPYRGWLLAYDATTLDQAAAYCTTKRPSGGGGIWQAGNGPAADANGNIYAMTGNGSYDPDAGEMSMSFIKLDHDLQLTDWFSPTRAKCLSTEPNDVDLGASGPVLLQPAALVVGGSKEGVMYVLDQDHLGHHQRLHSTSRPDGLCPHSGHDTTPPPLQSFQVGHRHEFPPVGPTGYHHIHGSPVVWQNGPNGPVIFEWPERDPLRAYRLDTATRRFLDAAPSGAAPTASYRSAITDPKVGMPGGILALSTDGREGLTGWPTGRPTTVIVWASMPRSSDAWVRVVPGILRALRATDLKELWNSEDRPEDHVGNFAKYTPPTIANGKVYLATFSNHLDVYGPLPPSPGGP